MTFAPEYVNCVLNENFEDATQRLPHFIEEVYQHKRIPSSPGYLTSAEFESQWRQAMQ